MASTKKAENSQCQDSKVYLYFKTTKKKSTSFMEKILSLFYFIFLYFNINLLLILFYCILILILIIFLLYSFIYILSSFFCKKFVFKENWLLYRGFRIFNKHLSCDIPLFAIGSKIKGNHSGNFGGDICSYASRD